MTVHRLSKMTWPEVREHARGAIAIWPIGAIEAHGPHLPLSTDVIISKEMARRAADRLAADEQNVLLVPPLAFTPAHYAGGFSGTLSVPESAVVDTVCGVAGSLQQHGVTTLAIANCHVDPANVKALHAAEAAVRNELHMRFVFPDICQKPWVLRLPEEFKWGGSHAGYFETSLVMAARPELVREEIRRALPKIDVDLAKKIRDGAKDFGACGGPDAYFGNPAGASIDDGNRFYDILADIVVEAISP
jgi:creatinine amidohydrolase